MLKVTFEYDDFEITATAKDVNEYETEGLRLEAIRDGIDVVLKDFLLYDDIREVAHEHLYNKKTYGEIE